jgi:NAD(P)-dependent dehydrogenase (short-subunit alcohol dehydrogenase family)
MRLCENRTAIVTGAAGRGMGRSIALTLAREGARVAVNYRSSKAEAEAIVDYLRKQEAEAIAVQADVFVKEHCHRLVNTALERFGRVDICVIGPGAGWHPTPPDALDADVGMDDVSREIAPCFHLMPLLLTKMYAQKWGRIVALGLAPPYVGKASRAQVLLLAKEEARQHGVTLNLIAPGPVSEIETLEDAIDQCNHGSGWQNRPGISPQDIAEGVAFLCSQAGRFITGCELPYGV